MFIIPWKWQAKTIPAWLLTRLFHYNFPTAHSAVRWPATWNPKSSKRNSVHGRGKNRNKLRWQNNRIKCVKWVVPVQLSDVFPKTSKIVYCFALHCTTLYIIKALKFKPASQASPVQPSLAGCCSVQRLALSLQINNSQEEWVSLQIAAQEKSITNGTWFLSDQTIELNI